MKPEPKVRKLTLKKETLRDLTAPNAIGVKGGACGLRTWTVWSYMGYTCKAKTCKQRCR
jgi:hypothetical protein